MKVPVQLAEAFGQPFEKLLSEFTGESLESSRFLSRSILPHVKKLSDLFNRVTPSEHPEGTPTELLSAYWKQSSNPSHLRLAYFLYFMPCNLFRVASVWSELSRLGYRWSGSDRLRGIEFGAGPAAGATGVAAGEKYAPIGLPSNGDWALIERDRASLETGAKWAERYFQEQGFQDWGTRSFHRTIDLKLGFLPKTAPKFNVWVMSYFLNELLESEPAERVARLLMDCWETHLEDEAIILMIEPALKIQSRKLLELRREILQEAQRRKATWLNILLPCLGHQSCGALSQEGDWCHEEVTWWRPPYMRKIDQLAGLDRKSLPFSYLAIAKTSRPREELLPALGVFPRSSNHRLVSPAHSEGKEFEFFICGEAGKKRARYRLKKDEETLERGDILLGAEIRGDVHSSRVERLKKIL